MLSQFKLRARGLPGARAPHPRAPVRTLGPTPSQLRHRLRECKTKCARKCETGGTERLHPEGNAADLQVRLPRLPLRECYSARLCQQRREILLNPQHHRDPRLTIVPELPEKGEQRGCHPGAATCQHCGCCGSHSRSLHARKRRHSATASSHTCAPWGSRVNRTVDGSQRLRD